MSSNRGGRGEPPRRGTRPPGARGTQERQSRRAERMALQRKQAQQRRMAALIVGGVVVLAVVIVAVVLIVHNNKGGSTAAPTPTVAPTVASSPAATVPISKATPAAAELSASKTACAPFLSAGNQPSGKGKWGAPPKQVIDSAKHYQVKLYTDAGVITADILPKLAPITANNFIFLACNGFYDNVIFHRTVPNFMIQGGDPLGTGSGGPGYQFQDEKVARAYQIGDMAMANSGPNTNGSQFFIFQGSQPNLPPQYNLFGHVTAGQNVVDTIANAPAHMMAGGVDNTPSAPNNPVHIRTITVQVS